MKPSNLYYRLPFLSIIAALLLSSVYCRRGYLDWKRMLKKNEEIVQKIELAKLEKQAIERKTQLLLTDKEEQERTIRNVLGYTRPDEIVIQFP
jgi:cell division protein FtsB